MQRVFRFSLVVSLLLLGSLTVQAFSLDWSGRYRFEYLSLDKPSLDDGSRKSYFLNHLELRPTIVATDNLKISAAFQVLPNSAYPSSKLGQVMGQGFSNYGGSDPAATLWDNQDGTSLITTELYLTWDQEFGALLVGRTPIQFGLGMTHNGGFGAFDHWNDIHDVVGYKMSFGNFFIMPMIGEVASEGIGAGAGTTDQMIHIEYENEESGSLFGVFYQTRNSDRATNDAVDVLPDAQSAVAGLDSSRVNIAVGRSFETMDLTVEGGFLSGDTGVRDSSGKRIQLDAFGVAAELNYHLEGSAFHSGVRMGYASGDDPNTTDKYEGYVFDKNYDVAMLLMNHPLGQRDFLRTGAYRDGSAVASSFDTEHVSNVIYFAPHITWNWTETIDLKNTLTYATLNTDPIPAQSVGTSLGFEWDIDLIYKPHDRVQWITQVGLLFPGEAFESGDEGLEANFAYGIGTKAAISF